MGIFGGNNSSIDDDYAAEDDIPVFGVEGIEPETGVEIMDNAKRIALDKIYAEEQTRKHFDEGKLADFADSLRENGLINPIRVQKVDGRYKIIAGERRYRAAKILDWDKIACIIEDGDIIVQLAENVQREDLKPIEEARAYQQAKDELGLTGKELAARIGVSPTKVTTSLRLLQLDPRLFELVDSGEISKSAMRDIQTEKDPDRQYEIAQDYLKNGRSLDTVKKATGKKSKKTTRGTTQKETINDISITARSQKKQTKAQIAEALRQMADKLDPSPQSRAA